MYFIFVKVNSYGLMGCKMGCRKADRLCCARTRLITLNFFSFQHSKIIEDL